MNGYNKLFNLIGIENSDIKDSNGDLLSELKRGKQKSKAQEIVKQYTEIIKRPDLKRYAIQQLDIFENPHYIEREDGRGKNGFYIEHLMPIMVYYLLQKNENAMYASVEELSCFVGLVTRNYKRIPLKEPAEINPQFTAAMLN